jgi:hypothetical protein
MKLAFATLSLAVLATTPEARYFRYERPIQVLEQQVLAQQAGQACVAIDPEIFAHAAPLLADLRLYANGAETPYTIRVATSVAGGKKTIPILNAGVRSGQTVFDAELPDRPYSDLQLDVTARNFIATAAVSGSHTKSGKLDTKLGEFTLFDLSRERLGRSTVLHLPESNFPYLHFRIAGPLRPEDITSLSVERLPATQPRYSTVAEASQATQKDHSTVLEFAVPAHVPVDRVVFVPGGSPAAFSRDVTVSAVSAPEKRADDQTQPPLPIMSSGSLLRIHKVQDGKRIDEERLSIDAPREEFDTPSKWTITIANGDDAPVSLKRVSLAMFERTLCFDAVANTAYSLRYGDEALTAPQYDYARLFTPQANALEIHAGPERLNSGWQPRPDARPFTERHRILLWVALVAVIALLAAIAFKSQKQDSKAA